MALFKCKMCGGDLDVLEGSNIAECEYCGTKQPVPLNTDDEQENLFNRANALRMKCEFDKAETQYEKILDKDNTQADAYWGLILCKYGIEYVDDPATRKKIPTCHRASYDSIIADEDYKSAIKYADMSQRLLYEQQAKEIDRIQKDILALAQNEETYDVFICYKETDANGQRTRDSVVANEIYHQLTQEGFKVFYAAITLEGKLGSAYEPIIFAALNSAKVMLVIGTKPEYFNAVWVKNEWSRFLKIIQKDHSKMLIPCYRDMDAYDLPDEFAHLQAQDMSKIGFVNDLIRGIKKVAKKKEAKQPAVVKETVITKSPAGDVAPILKRVFIFLEDGDWPRADEYCEKALDIDPECARAYLGKLMIDLRLKKEDQFQKLDRPFESNKYYQKVMQYGKEPWVWNLKEANKKSIERAEENRQSAIYKEGLLLANQKTPEKQLAAAKEFERVRGYRDAATRALECRHQAKVISYNRALSVSASARSISDYQEVWKLFNAISGYPPAQEKANEYAAKIQEAVELERMQKEMAEIERQDAIYNKALSGMKSDIIPEIEKAIKLFESIRSWKDSQKKIKECQQKIAAIKEQQEKKRLAQIRARKRRKAFTALIVTMVLIGLCGALAIGVFAIINDGKVESVELAIDRLPDNTDKVVDYYQEVEDALAAYEALSPHLQKKINNSEKLFKCVDILNASKDLEFLKCLDFTLNDDRSSYSVSVKKEYASKLSGHIVIPSSYRGKEVTMLAGNAFLNCKNITSVVVPNSVTQIMDGAFGGCSSLEEITLPFVGKDTSPDNPRWAVFGYIFGDGQYDDDTMNRSNSIYKTSDYSDYTSQVEEGSGGYFYFAIPKSLKKVTITNQIKVPDYAFNNCDLIEVINYTNAPYKIGSYAFAECTSLIEAPLKHGVETIGDCAFMNCKGFTSIVLPDSVTSIVGRTFMGCSNVTTIVVPDSVTKIGFGAFANCTSLYEITLPFIGSSIKQEQPRWNVFGYIFGDGSLNDENMDESKNIYKTSSSQGFTSQVSETEGQYFYYAIPKSLRKITITRQEIVPNYAFNNCDMLESIVFLKPSKSIGEYAFGNCSSLHSFLINPSTEDIGEGAFINCTSFFELIIPEGVNTIGHYAFWGLSNVTSIEVPQSVRSIGFGAFCQCTSLQEITLPFVGKNDNPDYPRWAVLGYIFGDNDFEDAMTYNPEIYLTSGTNGFTSQVTEDGGEHYYCYLIPQSLRRIRITSQTDIPDFAFKNCDLLEEIIYSSPITSQGTDCFTNCTASVIEENT